MKLLPMKCKQGEKEDLKKVGWIYEPKLDGIRALCFVNKHMKFISRNNNDLTKQYPEFNFRDAINAKNCVLDGEIVAYDRNGTLLSFSQWKTSDNYFSYVVFDILELNGKSLLRQPLLERKKMLDAVVHSKKNIEKIIFTPDGSKLYALMKKNHMEGVIAKDPESLYYSDVRTNNWLKIKLTKTVDCIIAGFTQEKRAISSLALALFTRNKKLQYIGKVGTGFNQENIKELHTLLKPLQTELSPIEKTLQEIPKGIHWVKPKIVAEIAYGEFTPQDILRHSRFVQIRYDKKPKECTFKEQGPT
jgi:bifunctional non-homologous end joining protein LigD